MWVNGIFLRCCATRMSNNESISSVGFRQACIASVSNSGRRRCLSGGSCQCRQRWSSNTDPSNFTPHFIPSACSCYPFKRVSKWALWTIFFQTLRSEWPWWERIWEPLASRWVAIGTLSLPSSATSHPRDVCHVLLDGNIDLNPGRDTAEVSGNLHQFHGPQEFLALQNPVYEYNAKRRQRWITSTGLWSGRSNLNILDSRGGELLEGFPESAGLAVGLGQPTAKHIFSLHLIPCFEVTYKFAE